MNGGGILIALYILVGIIAFFILILSINIRLFIDYEEVLTVGAQWLFLKIKLFPLKKKEKKAKKEEKPKEEKPKEEKPKEEKAKVKKRSPLLVFYDNVGVDGVLEILGKVMNALGGMFGTILRHVIIRGLYLEMMITSGDAASTAIKYGKTCEKAFPAMGYICSKMKVKKYDMEIYPDFLAPKDKVEYHVHISFRPLFAVHAVIILVVKLIFRVLIKFLRNSKPKVDMNTLPVSTEKATNEK